MPSLGSPSAGRYTGVLSKEHIRLLTWLERSGMCTREEALAGSALGADAALMVLMQLERHYLAQETAGLLRITVEGSALLTSLGLGLSSLHTYIPTGSLPEFEQRWLESMALQYREHYHAAWLNTLRCLKFWSWIRHPRSRKYRRKRKPVKQYITLLIHDLLFHHLPPVFPPGYVYLEESPSFLLDYIAERDTDPVPRYSLAEFLRLKDLFFHHERYSMMYLLEARHYRAQHFRLNMRNIYRYFLLETRPHRKTVAPPPPPPGTKRLPELVHTDAEDIRHIPQDYWPLQIPCAAKHFFRDNTHDRISQVIHVAPFTIRIHDVVTRAPLQLAPVPSQEACCSLQVLQRVKPGESSEKLAFFGCGSRQESDAFGQFHLLPAEVYYCAFRLDVGPEDLVRLSATWPQLSPLAGKAAAWLHGVQPAIPLRANELVNMLLSQVLHCTYIGDVAECFLRRICLDLLLTAAVQSNINASKRRIRLTPTDKLALQEIFTQARHDVGLLADPHLLTDNFHISRYKFLNGFLQEFGISPKDYQQMLVMHHAFHLLHRHGKSMIITAIRCGFETTAALRSAFIRHFGADPCHLAHMQ
ncbi:helix-turn-helix domain-containing protein [Chitinophaga pollutisoli]|uniref:Helix-turn-helix domain-containing protein n=1 Tax=Chitinophaga pollutisoli TaxID=3133966 RepID=A0ABZ2YVV2_9BACT